MKKWVVGVLFFCAAAYGATQWGNLLVKGTLTVDGPSNLAGVNFATATNSVRLLLPTETTTNLDALTDVAGLIAYDTTQSKVVYNNGSAWTAVGSGSGGTNNQTEFITNGTFENDSAGGAPTGWAKYADAAATSPVDCTGGSPNSTFLATSTSGEVIRGTKSGELVKGAANRQGEGISYDFTIDPKDYGTLSPVYLSADYNNTSGYASSDVKVFVYDKDAATLLTVQDVSGLSGALPSSTGGTKWTGVFYPTSTTSNDYRLCFHVSSTSATAYDFHLDSVHAGDLGQSPGFFGSAWTSYTPIITHASGGVTNATISGYWRLVGDTMEVRGMAIFSNTSASFSQWIVSLPSGYTIDPNKIISTTADRAVLGQATFLDTGVINYPGVAILKSTTTVILQKIITASGSNPVDLNNADIAQNTPFTFNNTDTISWHFTVPISNAQASAALSANEILYSTCKVVAESTAATSFSDTTETDVPYATETEDNCSAYDGTTFTAPKTAKYLFNVRLAIDGMSANCSHLQYLNLTNASNTQQALINAGGICYASYYGNGSVVLRLTKGDQIKVRAYQGNGATRTRSTSASQNRLEITEQPDFSIMSQFNTVDRQYSMTCSGPSGWSTVNCKGLPYLTADGAWRLKFNISGTKTSGNNAQISITGVTFKSGYRQSVSCNDDSGGSAPSNCFAEGNTAYIQLSFASSQTSVTASGDVELNSKPTFVP